MNKNGPILVIDDDADDRYIMTEILAELGYPNNVVVFADGESAYDYLTEQGVHPFLILSDVNMPKIDGFELRHKVLRNETLKNKWIPFLLITTSTNRKTLDHAYELSVPGFFIKPNTYMELKNTLQTIIEYWLSCYAPQHENYSRTDLTAAA